MANAVMDSLFGTRYHTEGATIQRPRKVPMRVEPKSYFANERTFLSWCSMATTMGGVSSALVGLTITSGGASGGGSGGGSGSGGRVISARTVDMITAIYVPVAVIMVLYALFQYGNRSRFMQRKQVGFFDDRVGPVALAGMVLLTLLLITAIALVDVLA